MRLPLSLETRLGRRIVLLFIVSALVPLIVLAVLGYTQVRGQLLAQRREQLQQAAKNVGMGVLEQLRAARAEFDALAGAGVDPADPRWRTVFTAVAIAEGAVIGGRWGDVTTLPVLDAASAARVDSGLVALVVEAGDSARAWLVGRSRSSRVWAALAPAYVFRNAPERAAVGTAETALCVRDGGTGRPLVCDAGGFGGDERVAMSWDMFLGYDYQVAPWRVEVSQPVAAVLAPVVAFRRVFVAAVAGVLGLVVLLSHIQVRRSLRPLEELRRGTERLARRDFSGTVRVVSRDEFADLAGSFNSMARELDHTIVRLDQLSYGALAALARAVDASSHWTAGHSERVTTMSMHLAAKLALADAQLDALHRGGLLHDIGKIGISPLVLDKPGILDAEELLRIRQHPELGARILAPLEAFADAIPVVRSHHERFDGAGYPDGLAGQAIPFLARLLAVADVYDALVSDRPYRPGWPKPDAITSIERGAGTQFDPDMVEVFLAVIRETGDQARFAWPANLPGRLTQLGAGA